MSIRNKIAQYKEFRHGVSHCTFNPNGPGVVRIHLIPPKFTLFGNSAYIVILNGYYLLPIGYSWAIVLSRFMAEVNRFDGKPINEADEENIIKNTIRAVHRIYPSARREDIEDDLFNMLEVIFAVARGKDTDAEIEKLSIRAYGRNMTAPHRMDIMVSAMTNENGKWNCNQKCRFCYAAGQYMGKAKELSTEEWKKVIDKLDDAMVPMVTFTGGEPTMRDDIDILVGYSKRMITRLNTNGVNLTKELAAKLKVAGLDSVQVTLYSHDEDIHNDLVGCERFADTVNGIKNAVEAGLDISINTPICKKNADYKKTLEFIDSLGVRFVTASGLICTGMAAEIHNDHDLSDDELFNIIKTAKEYCDNHSMEIDFTSPGLIAREKLESINMNVPSCGAALSNMAIAPDGEVVPCQSWLESDSGLGNILDCRFKDIWNSKKCVKLRNMTDDEALSCPFRSGKDG